MFKADYQHLLPLKNSSNLFKGPQTAPLGLVGPPSPLSAWVGPLKSDTRGRTGRNTKHSVTNASKCRLRPCPTALTYSNLTPQRDLFDKRGFKQSTATAQNCCDTNKTKKKDFVYNVSQSFLRPTV